MRKKRNKQLGQAIVELTVFGAIIIFLIGAIIRQGISSTQRENQQMKSMRLAMKMSYMQSVLGEGDGNTSRNNASYLIIEDRLSPDFGRYGSLSRVPQFSQGSGTFSNNLLMPLDWNEPVPVFDLLINGQHFDLTTARFVTKTFKKEDAFYEIVTNGSQQGFCVSNCPVVNLPNGDRFGVRERFDLNRNKNYNDDPRSAEQRALMSWQWSAQAPSEVKKIINVEDGVYPYYDVDGDHQPETIYGITLPCVGKSCYDDQGVQRDLDGVVKVLDYQEGDVDFSRGSSDYEDPRLMPGVKQESDIYTRSDDGTYLLLQEGASYDNRSTYDLVSSTTSKGQIDVVSRMIRLSADTGRWCKLIPRDDPIDARCKSSNKQTVKKAIEEGVDCDPYKKVRDTSGNAKERIKTDEHFNEVKDYKGDVVKEYVYMREPNYPVEACYDCFSQKNISKTCFDEVRDIIEVNGTPTPFKGFAIFVRSRILDTRTRQWITDFSGDIDGFGNF